MAKPKILVQLDGDEQASVFDAVVAIDSDIDHLLQYRSVQAEQVRDLVHGAMFTRGPQDLHNTAIFIGGANVAHGESLLQAATKSFFGPMRVSVMFDASGANTTAAAAAVAAARHVNLSQSEALVLAATGPVGQRVVRLLAHAGCRVRVASRSAERATAICEQVCASVERAVLTPLATSNSPETATALDGANIVIAAGAAGIELLSAETWAAGSSLQVAIDLNAVPPLGIGGVAVTDQAVDRDGVTCYGAIGVGGTKMKIHKAAIKKLFSANDLVLNAEELYGIGRELEGVS